VFLLDTRSNYRQHLRHCQDRGRTDHHWHVCQ